MVCHKSGEIREKRGVWKNYTELGVNRWEYTALSHVKSCLFRHPRVCVTSFGAAEGPLAQHNARLPAEFFSPRVEKLQV